jgi:hypothetical protein
VLDRLLQGQNVAQSVQDNWQLREQRFQSQLRLALATPPEDRQVESIPLPKASPFQQLSAVVAWESDAAESPNCLQLTPRTKTTAPRLLVLDSMRNVLEFDLAGQMISQTPLDLEESTYVGQLQCEVDSQGRAYHLGFSQFGRFVHVFDANFRRVLRYPSDDQTHNGITDAVLLDLDQDGDLELYVAFAHPLGCQNVTFQGTRNWSNRTMPAVLSLAGDARQTTLFATGESGWVLPIGADGQSSAPIMIGKRTIHQLVSNTAAASGATDFLGMSYTIEGRLIAVGLDAELREQWVYGLPGGVFRHQVRSPVGSTLWQGSWLIAGPEGSIHVIKDDGSFFDHLNLGTDVLGLQGLSQDGTHLLFVATQGKVTAYRLSSPNDLHD